jgi:F-type H+-transporting ATPase subunit gamma
MPTLKEIATRIKAVAAIKDTTEAMKMIAQARVAKAEQRLHYVRSFTRELESSFAVITAEGVQEAPENPKTQLLALGTDQGLCGSINSGMARAVVAKTDAFEAGTDWGVFAFGNRLISNLTSKMEEKMLGAVFGSQKQLSFRQCLAVSEHLLTFEASTKTILYNKMLSMAAFEVAEVDLAARGALELAEEGSFDIEGPNEVMEDLYDYHFAVLMWRIFSEVEASELSSRAMAMTNSTTAAGEMEAELKLIYSKLRQEQITTEIIEISTGATQTMKANKKE